MFFDIFYKHTSLVKKKSLNGIHLFKVSTAAGSIMQLCIRFQEIFSVRFIDHLCQGLKGRITKEDLQIYSLWDLQIGRAKRVCGKWKNKKNK